MMLAEVIQHSRVKEFAGSEDGYLVDALAPFVQFCKSNGQKYCLTTPDVVAAYVTALALFQSEQTITDALRAIELLHDQFGYSNPVACAAVRKAWSKIVAFDPPRSWTKEEKELFKTVSPPLMAIITRREAERDKALRQSQSKLAEEMKRVETELTRNKLQLRNHKTEQKEEITNANENQQAQ